MVDVTRLKDGVKKAWDQGVISGAEKHKRGVKPSKMLRTVYAQMKYGEEVILDISGTTVESFRTLISRNYPGELSTRYVSEKEVAIKKTRLPTMRQEIETRFYRLKVGQSTVFDVASLRKCKDTKSLYAAIRAQDDIKDRVLIDVIDNYLLRMERLA